MPKLVCRNCRFEFMPSTNGVNVLEMAAFGPYKIWQADELECPGCHFLVITGFPSVWHEHYQDGFAEELRRILAPENRQLLRLDFENGTRRAEWVLTVNNIVHR